MKVCRRVRFIVDIDDKCIMGHVNIPEFVVHKFWDCRIAHTTWDFATRITDTLNAKPRHT